MTLKIGRNEPCPCRSGKKYKRCCWHLHHGITTAQAEAARALLMRHSAQVECDDDDQRFTALSNSIVDLVDDGRLDEAERACDRLRAEYPDRIDWLDRTAMIAEARHDLRRAAEFYRRCVAHVQAHEGAESDMVAVYHALASKAEAALAAQGELFP